jgi:hypothetical protein
MLMRREAEESVGSFIVGQGLAVRMEMERETVGGTSRGYGKHTRGPPTAT